MTDSMIDNPLFGVIWPRNFEWFLVGAGIGVFILVGFWKSQ